MKKLIASILAAVILLANTTVNACAAPGNGSGTVSNDKAVIDCSDTDSGCVTVSCTAAGKRMKVLVYGPDEAAGRYAYDLAPGSRATIPLTGGNGRYRIMVMENISGIHYRQILDLEVDAAMEDGFAPFLRPNQLVDYSSAPNTAAKAEELAGAEPDPARKIDLVFGYLADNLTYDQELADTVESGYLPDLDTVLGKGKGICFDYAALMAGMLRSLGVPCKLVTGCMDGQPHAWVHAWDGSAWVSRDPTAAAALKGRPALAAARVLAGISYQERYFY